VKPLRLNVSPGLTSAPATLFATTRMLTPESCANPPVVNSPMTSSTPSFPACSVVTFAGLLAYRAFTSRPSVRVRTSSNGLRLASQSTVWPSTDGCTPGFPPVNTIRASLPSCSDGFSCGSAFATIFAWSTIGVSVPPSPAANVSAAAMSDGVSFASRPSPLITTAADTAGFAMRSSTSCTAADDAFTGFGSTGSSMTSPETQRERTSLAAAAVSSFRPGIGSTATGRTPSNRTVPSTGSWSALARRSSMAAANFGSSARVTTPTSRLENSDVSRVTGLSGWPPAASIVAGKSMCSPAAEGSSDSSTSAALTRTGWVSLDPSRPRSSWSAPPRLIPPRSTPATLTPRGTSPWLASRSMP
jgi:hypothetical protein